jgi:hypothetical protein
LGLAQTHSLFLLDQKKQTKKIKASFYLFLLRRGGGRNYFFLQNCDLSGDIRAKALIFPKGSRILLHKNNQTK